MFNLACLQEPLTEEQARDYILLYRKGDKNAAGVIVASQVKWIWKLVKNMRKPPGTDEEEVVGQLVYDLLASLENYDPDKGSLTAWTKSIVTRRGRSYCNILGTALCRPASTTSKESWLAAAAVFRLDQDRETYKASESLDDGMDIKSMQNFEEMYAAIREIGSTLPSPASDVLEMMLGGASITDIAIRFGWKSAEAATSVNKIRSTVAIGLKNRGFVSQEFTYVEVPGAVMQANEPTLF